MREQKPYRPGRRGRVWGHLAVAVVVGLGLAACESATGTPEPKPAPEKPEPKPMELTAEEAATALALAEQVEGVLAAALSTLSRPSAAAQVEGLEALAEFVALLDPMGEQPGVEGCAPMLTGADEDGDGYPAVEETLMIACRIEVPFVFELTGELTLGDEDDTDPESGFYIYTRLDYRLTVTADGTTTAAVGERRVRVRAASGGGYAVAYEGGDTLDAAYLAFEARLSYRGTLAGTFASGTLAIDEGMLVLASTPVDCTALAGAEREACMAQDNPGPSEMQLSVQSARLDYDTAGCASVLTGGGVMVAAGADRVLGVSYEGCGERTVTYNGVAVPQDGGDPN